MEALMTNCLFFFMLCYTLDGAVYCIPKNFFIKEEVKIWDY